MQESQTPVMGRILNPVTRGYAVGLGGVVGFCPMSQCLFRTAQRVGVLQPFLVASVRETMTARGVVQPNIVVVDASKRQEVRLLGLRGRGRIGWTQLCHLSGEITGLRECKAVLSRDVWFRRTPSN